MGRARRAWRARRTDADLGRRPSSSARFNAATAAATRRATPCTPGGPARGSAQLGRTPGSGCPASSTGSGCTTRTAAPASDSGADLGFAPGRIRAGRRAAGRRRKSASSALLGGGASGRRGTGSGCNRLGRATRKRPSRHPAGAFVERAGRSFFVGRSKDRGAGRTPRAFVVSTGCARRSAGLVCPGPS